MERLEEALIEATDCLSEALAGRIVDGESLPAPSAPRRGQYLVAPDETLALKLALHQALADRKMTAADLARTLGYDHKEARRLSRSARNEQDSTSCRSAWRAGFRREVHPVRCAEERTPPLGAGREKCRSSREMG
jgi:antitoxin HicB